MSSMGRAASAWSVLLIRRIGGPTKEPNPECSLSAGGAVVTVDLGLLCLGCLDVDFIVDRKLVASWKR